MLPGVGGSAASILAYAQAKNFSKHPELLGTGAPEGLVASESSNNGLTGGALIPLLSLGIPGDSTTAEGAGRGQGHEGYTDSGTAVKLRQGCIKWPKHEYKGLKQKEENL